MKEADSKGQLFFIYLPCTVALRDSLWGQGKRCRWCGSISFWMFICPPRGITMCWKTVVWL